MPMLPTTALPPFGRAAPLPALHSDADAVQPGPPLAFVLFIVVNAVLLIRPAEILPELEGIELYFYAIGLCALFAAGDVLQYLTGTRLSTQPITLCILALCVIALFPHLVAFKLDEAWKTGFHFFKNLVYFLLFVSIVNTPGRLRWFVCALLVIGAISVGVAVLDYHQIIALPSIKAVKDTEVGNWGEVTSFERLQFSGILKDPNDLCVWLATLVPLALYNLVQQRDLLRRVLGLGALLLFGYAIFLTRSRGGFLAMLAGLGVTVAGRYGRQRAALVAVVGLPLLLVLFAGRQTSLDANTGTGQARVQIWSDWLDRFREQPLLGVGVELRDIAPEQQGKDARAAMPALGHAAHNSFLQAFADTGFAGGCLFLGAFGVALWSLRRVGQAQTVPRDADTHDMQPFLLGATAAYGVGMLTLSLWIIAPTYIILALAASYPRVDRCDPPVPPVPFDPPLLGRFALAGIGFLAAVYVFVRLFVNWG